MDQLKGVGGWLGFLVFSLLILTPIYNISLNIQAISEAEAADPILKTLQAWSNLKTFTWASTTLTCVIYAAAGYRLWKDHRESTPAFAIWCLWIAGPAISVVNVLVVSALTGASTGDILSDPEAIRTTVQSITFAVIWSLYLKKSERVANTYAKPFLG